MGWATKKGPPTGSTGSTPPIRSKRLQLAPLQLRHVTLQPRQALHHRARRRQRRGAHWRRRHGANDGTPFGETTNVVRKFHGTWMNRSEHGFKTPMISWTLMDMLMDFQNVMCQKMSETMRMRGFPDMFMPTIFYECQLKGSKMFQNPLFSGHMFIYPVLLTVLGSCELDAKSTAYWISKNMMLMLFVFLCTVPMPILLGGSSHES